MPELWRMGQEDQNSETSLDYVSQKIEKWKEKERNRRRWEGGE